jgi:transposase
VSIYLDGHLVVTTNHLPSRQLPRKQYSIGFKREVVEQSFVRNASIAAVAREHGINANILWRWRNEYEAGKFGAVEQVTFLPINLEPAPAEPVKQTPAEPTGYLALQIGSAKLTIHGRPDLAVLKNVIEALR